MTANEALSKIRVMLGVEKEVEPQTPTQDIQLAEATLVDGSMVKCEGELEVGNQLLVVTDEGEIPAPEGVHEPTEGLLISVDAQGVITDIAEPSTEEPAEEAKAEFGEDVVNQIVGGLQPLFDNLQEQINSLKGEFSAFREEPAGPKITNNISKLNEADNSIQSFRLNTIMNIRKNNNK